MTTLLLEMPLWNPSRAGQLAYFCIGAVGAFTSNGRVVSGIAPLLLLLSLANYYWPSAARFARWAVVRPLRIKQLQLTPNRLGSIDPWFRSGGGRRAAALAVSAVVGGLMPIRYTARSESARLSNRDFLGEAPLEARLLCLQVIPDL